LAGDGFARRTAAGYIEVDWAGNQPSVSRHAAGGRGDIAHAPIKIHLTPRVLDTTAPGG
jgi:hypothetical protein